MAGAEPVDNIDPSHFLKSITISHSAIQTAAALSIYRSGTLILLFGLAWGLMVAKTPFPKLSLTAHIQAMDSSMMMLITGLLTKNSDLIYLSTAQARVLVWKMNSIWPAVLVQIANAWWGTNQMLAITAAAAKATGGMAMQEMMVADVLIVESLSLITALAILVLAVFRPDGNKKQE